MMNRMVFLLLFLSISLSLADAIKVYDSDQAQVETPIVINPTNPDNLVGAAIAISDAEKRIDVYYSFNGGTSWTALENVSGSGGADAVLAFDNDGNVYLIYQKREYGDLFIQKSSDGGQNWTVLGKILDFNPSERNLDKPWMAISPHRNPNGYFDIYVSVTTGLEEPGAYELVLLKSEDSGNSFTQIYTISGLNQGVSLAAGPGEEGKDIAIAYSVNNSSSDPQYIAIKHDFEGSYFQNSVTYQVTRFGDKDNHAIKQQSIKADTYPRMAMDAYKGDYYIVWADKAGNLNSDIKLVKAKKENDGTVTWEFKGFIITGEGYQFNPAISVTPDGVISILYYSTTEEANTPVYTYLVRSTDGGNSFGGRVTIGETDGFVCNKFLGDYQGLASWFNTAYTFFCQMLNHGQGIDDRQVYFQNGRLTPMPR